jgi:UDP-N-acetyl-D-galactosamine dehydrogenase
MLNNNYLPKNIAIIGLGYVGLPLAVEFGKKINTIGFDVSRKRINELKNYIDNTNEVSVTEIRQAKRLKFTSKLEDILSASCFIITVPTPIDKKNKPDLSALKEATESIGFALKKNDIVIYESTVYPGCTEEICVPILEKYSGLKFNIDFFLGYSPERINPGDKKHRLINIKKITSGSNEQVTNIVDKLYNKIIKAGTYKVRSIKIAEAAKIIENTQRDLNIALINELSVLFNILDIDTESVLKAAASKWNFMYFEPGIVGGHCIGVDPYYLTFKAKKSGYHPEIILAGRKLNDSMPKYITSRLFDLFKSNLIKITDAKVLFMGLTFKENCPDIRNTKVIEIIKILERKKIKVEIYDPWVDPKFVQSEFGIKCLSYPHKNKYDAIVLAVKHDKFREIGIDNIRKFGKNKSIIFDLKYIFNKEDVNDRL